MIIKNIEYTSRFQKEFRKLSDGLQLLVSAKEKLFRDNPLHPSLRLHRLSGKLTRMWSITITMNFRIIFNRKKNGDIVFHSIGKHDIYKSL